MRFKGLCPHKPWETLMQKLKGVWETGPKKLKRSQKQERLRGKGKTLTVLQDG